MIPPFFLLPEIFFTVVSKSSPASVIITEDNDNYGTEAMDYDAM